MYHPCTIKLIAVLLLLLTFPLFAQVKKANAEEVYEQGTIALGYGRLEEAKALFSRSVAENPGYAQAYAARATVYERLADGNAALRDYTISLELDPNQYEVLLSRGALLFQLKKYTEAKNDFRKLLRLPAGETNTIFYRQSAHSPGTDQILTAQGGIHAQVYNYLGLIETQLKSCLSAIHYLDSAIVLAPNEPDYYCNRALTKKMCGVLGEEDDLKKALALNPNHPIARNNLASISASKGNYQLAEQELTEAIETDPMMLDPYLERAYFRLLRKDYAGALADYNQAIKLNRLDPEIWLNRGVVKEKLFDLVGAYRDYTEAIELDAVFVKAWINRGNILAAQKKYVEAIEDYSAAITYQPDYGVAYYNRAIAYFRLNKMNEACSDLKRAERLNYPVDQKVKDRFCKKS
ncbi:MAG: tetratricopeptide repeat protein [Cyclobacteriaceae bacterium]|nr:tetratricopeptide repeat protein [Cyclobacteriaceae bacterium]